MLTVQLHLRASVSGYAALGLPRGVDESGHRADIQKVDGYCHPQAWANFEKILNILSLSSRTSKMAMLLASSPVTS